MSDSREEYIKAELSIYSVLFRSICVILEQAKAHTPIMLTLSGTLYSP